MRYTPFDKSLADITPDDLATLKEVYEGWYAEYKSEMINNRALAKSLSAFANQYGGWLFLGVLEDSNSNAAKSFPGISNTEVHDALESLRNASKDLLRPAVYYDSRVFEGPIEAINLRSGHSIIAIRIPQGPNPPYVHNDGRIYQRIADSSDPKPVTDRATFDLLFDRGIRTRSRLADRIEKSPLVSKGEENQPYIHFNIFSDPYEVLRHWYRGTFLDFSRVMREGLLEFDNIFPSSEGYIARQVSTNEPQRRVFTWEFSRKCHSFVTVPVSVLPAIETDMAWLQYVTGNDYISTLVDNALEHVTILDINQLLGLSGSIIARHRNLAAQANVEGPFYVKVHIENVWRTTPFVDIPSYLAHISEYHFPVVQDSDIVIPDGVSEEAFIRISERNPSSETISFSGGSEGFTLSDLFSISMPILNALGIPLREVVDGKEQELIDLVKRVHKPRIAG